jgi:hypothetical protein
MQKGNEDVMRICTSWRHQVAKVSWDWQELTVINEIGPFFAFDSAPDKGRDRDYSTR